MLRRKNGRFTALVAALLFLALPSACGEFQAKVIAVADGDTIDVLHGLRAERIRLHGVDAPERSQAFGSRARQFTAGLVFGAIVTVRGKGRDSYGRVLAEIVLRDGRILNRELVADGFAWHYKRYSSDRELARLEQVAGAQKRGLWADAHPIAPSEFRARQRWREPAHAATSRLGQTGVKERRKRWGE
jgi:endonuclease YncB( thermonuclease family)